MLLRESLTVFCIAARATSGWRRRIASSTFFTLTISQVAPILPYLFLVLILIFRPKGLLGTREG